MISPWDLVSRRYGHLYSEDAIQEMTFAEIAEILEQED